jgi:low affinity Fe/Cu permease
MGDKINKIFDKLASNVTHFAGSSAAFGTAFFVIFIWIISGPVFHFSDTWQLVINTGTTIITFLMVFLIQRAQNKDSEAIQIKLNELIASTKGASNTLIDIESLTEEQLDVIHKYYAVLADQTKKSSKISRSHSVAKAKERALKK